MAAPNIVNVAAIYGKTAVQVIAATATAVVTNSAGSNKVLKVNSVLIANVDGATSYTVNIDLYRSTTAYRMAYQVSVPAGATLDLLSKSVYLEEGDSLRFAADTAGKLEAVVSYEVIE